LSDGSNLTYFGDLYTFVHEEQDQKSASPTFSSLYGACKELLR